MGGRKNNLKIKNNNKKKSTAMKEEWKRLTYRKTDKIIAISPL